MSTTSQWIWFVTAIAMGLLGGVLFGVQPSVNGALSKQLQHPLQASLISFLTGTAILVAIAVVMGVFPPKFTLASPSPWSTLPWWTWGGGAIGAFLVTASLVFVPRIGSLPWNGTVIAGQLAAAMVLDHYGLLGNSQVPMTATRLAGAVCLIVGVVLIFWTKTATR